MLVCDFVSFPGLLFPGLFVCRSRMTEIGLGLGITPDCSTVIYSTVQYGCKAGPYRMQRASGSW
jgi:hypothetical protein